MKCTYSSESKTIPVVFQQHPIVTLTNNLVSIYLLNGIFSPHWVEMSISFRLYLILKHQFDNTLNPV